MSQFQQTRVTRNAAIEAQLIALCRSGQAGWEAELIQWLASDAGWLLRRCTRRMGSVSEAEDALQEITLKILRAIEHFEERSSLRTWVIRIADNHCFTLIKRRNATALSDHLQHCIFLLEGERYQPAQADDESRIQVGTALKALSENNQEVLQLRFFKDLSLDEMATSLNLSLSATKMRLYRAMDAFKKKYEYLENDSCDFHRTCGV